MVIRKGVDWGAAGILPLGAPTVGNNVDLRAAIKAGERTIGITGGDLWRTLGAGGSMTMTFPIDLVHLRTDTLDEPFVAHCIARRGWWRGPITAIMNAQFVGPWDVAPRGHPNDGRADVVSGNLGIGDRLKARPRLANGTYVPHPDISQRSITSEHFEFGGWRDVWLDGECIGRLERFSIEVEADALVIVR